jgi:hypothetical protein
VADQNRIRIFAHSNDPGRPGDRWLVIAIAVLVVLAVGFLIGRVTAPGGSSPGVPLQAGNPGPTRLVSGVPIGYAHSSPGAVAALLNYSAVLGNPAVLLNPSRRKQVLAVLATPGYAKTFEGPGAVALNAARNSPVDKGIVAGAQTVYFASPIAYHVLSYTPAVAVVQGWGVSVIGNNQGVAPQATWGSTTTTARWVGGDWKIDLVSSTNGPVPALAAGEQPSGAGEFLSGLAGLQQPHHAP